MKNPLKSPKIAAKIHLNLAVVWVFLMIPTVLYWSQSVLWVGIMSCYALFGAHMSSYQSATGAGVDEATRLKLNAIADALAHLMENSSDTSEFLRPHVEELRRTVGIEKDPDYEEDPQD
jgi:hypothetical protein